MRFERRGRGEVNPVRSMGWISGGLSLAAVAVAAIVLVEPIGVSSLFTALAAVLAGALPDGSGSDGYELVFVLAMIAGAFVSARLGGPRIDEPGQRLPGAWVRRFVMDQDVFHIRLP